MFQVLSTGQRAMVAKLNRKDEITEMYFSESDPYLVENARNKLASFDLTELPCQEISESQFELNLLRFKEVLRNDT